MNIANGTAAAISLQSLPKKTDGKAKNGAFLGKVIAKSGKEIQVLINDKVYKIEPGNAQNIKVGDKIQVFFGKNLPQDISEEMLKKISGKLIDVFSLSLPYKTTKELENLINQMPQNERLQFAKISNEIVQMIESIIKEDGSFQAEKASSATPNSLNLYDPHLPYNRRLLELSLKVKEMGKAWDQIPENIKKEIIKKYVLFDLPKLKDTNQNQLYDNKNNALMLEKDINHEKSNVSVTSKEENLNPEKGLQVDGRTNEYTKKDLTQGDLRKKTTKNEGSENKKNTSQSTLLKRSSSMEKNQTRISEKTIPLQQKQQMTYFSETKINLEKKEIDYENFKQETTTKNEANDLLSGTSTSNENKKNTGQYSVFFPSSTKTEYNAVQTFNEAELANKVKTNIYENQNKMTDMAYQTKKEKNANVLYSKEDVKKITKILENIISKPLAIEKNINNTNRIMNLRLDEKKSLESLGNGTKQTKLSRETENILQLIKKISTFNDFSDHLLLKSLSEMKNTILDFLSTDTFEKMTHSPLLNIEIKNMIASLKEIGIPEREASNTTLDIVNLASRAIKEDNISQQLYTMSLKRYLKIKLPHLIIENNIDQNKESGLMQKVEAFSKKAFLFVRTYAERLVTNKGAENNQQSEISSLKNFNSEKSVESKNTVNSDNSQKPKSGFTNFTSKDAQNRAQSKDVPEKIQLKGLNQNEQLIRNQTIGKNKELMNNRSNEKQELVLIQKSPRIESEKVIKNENTTQSDTKFREIQQKNDFHSEKFLKFLNISSEKNDLSNSYSALIGLNEQPFVIDFHHQKTEKSGYEKNEIYRVFIETNTQLFGTVFVDTVVSNKNIDIYIYAEEKYAKEFTNHSSTLIKRIKETDYNLRGLFIKEKLDQNGILKLKIKQYTNPKKEGGFYSFA